MKREETLRRWIRDWLWFFVVGLFLSGVTAIPLQTELDILARWQTGYQPGEPGFAGWILRVRDALHYCNIHYPFLAYGTDWLAFGHFIIALAFVGPLRDPVKNIWVIDFGMIACVLVIPFALVMGQLRGIPFGWRLIDCSFGVLGIIPLWLCKQWILELARLEDVTAAPRDK